MSGLFPSNSRKSWEDTLRGIRSNTDDTATHMHFNSFSGTDIKCYMFSVHNEAEELRSKWGAEGVSKKEYLDARAEYANSINNRVRVMGELQTLTVSIATSFGPVRRLGEREVVEYKGGARTVAGSLIFAVLNRDVFTEYTQGRLGSEGKGYEWDSPNYVDQIPEFNILVQGSNEFGAVSSGMLIGVRLTNFGTTFSVDDLFTEATYNYVARHFMPFTDENWSSRLTNYVFRSSMQAQPLSSAHLNGGKNFWVEVNGEAYKINRALYEWWQDLPSETARDQFREHLPFLQEGLMGIRGVGDHTTPIDDIITEVMGFDHGDWYRF